MSAAAASSTCPASARPFSITAAAASTSALPLAMIEREPPVPPPAISWSLSPCTRSIASNGRPSRVDQHLGEGRGVALAVVERAGDDRHPPVRLEADPAHLGIGRGGDLEIAGEPAPAQPALLLRAPPARGEAVPVGLGEAGREHRREIAAVVFRARRSRCRGALRAGSGCAAAARPGRGRSRAPRHRSAAPCSSSPRAARRRDRARPARCW